jgi:Domain of unknown function (DUF1707)/Cell wall-active antibiotics response 4TMS YvqF
VSEPPELRISDADRERAIKRLDGAVAEGRLTMSEFDERLAGVLRARTGSDLTPYLADLPASPTAPEAGQLRATMSTIKRTGRWVVPRRLSVSNKAGSVKLDLTNAVIAHPVLEIAIEVYAGSTTLVLPQGASVDVEGVELVAGSAKVRKVPTSIEPIGEPHVVVTGKQWAGSVTVRHQYRFFRWRW